MDEEEADALLVSQIVAQSNKAHNKLKSSNSEVFIPLYEFHLKPLKPLLGPSKPKQNGESNPSSSTSSSEDPEERKRKLEIGKSFFEGALAMYKQHKAQRGKSIFQNPYSSFIIRTFLRHLSKCKGFFSHL
jgi:hypothetical protein